MNMYKNQNPREGAKWLCTECAGLSAGESALIICDPKTMEVGALIFEVAECCDAETLMTVIPSLSIHGQEPPERVAKLMQEADVIFCLTKSSQAHTAARARATANGARFLSLPDYSMEVLSSEALLTQFGELASDAMQIGEILEKGSEVRITSLKGTDISFKIQGRSANQASGLVIEKGSLGSPPDSEVNIAPIETSCEGIFIVDGSIPCQQLGLLADPIQLEFDKGKVAHISGKNKDHVDILEKMFKNAGPESKILGEFGIGLNPNAKLCGVMLIDEGARGTVHLGIGSNSTIGGENIVPFHLDFVMMHATVEIDGRIVLNEGQVLI